MVKFVVVEDSNHSDTYLLFDTVDTEKNKLRIKHDNKEILEDLCEKINNNIPYVKVGNEFCSGTVVDTNNEKYLETDDGNECEEKNIRSGSCHSLFEEAVPSHGLIENMDIAVSTSTSFVDEVKLSKNLDDLSSILEENENENWDLDDIESIESLYQPSENESTAESDECDLAEENPSNHSKKFSEEMKISFDSSLILNASFNVPGNSACNDADMLAGLSRGKKGDKKNNFCIYCREPQSKISRHLETRHRDEPAVVKFSLLKKGTAERNKEIGLLRKKGNFLFNVSKAYNKGELITVRRPQCEGKRSAELFTACPNCKGFYTKNNLRHHHLKCVDGAYSSSEGVIQRAREVMGRIHERASQAMRHKVLPKMRETDRLRLIRYDLLIILYGNELCMRHRKNHLYKMIRAKLSLIGRLLEQLKTLHPDITDFASLYDPKYYDNVVDAINLVVGLDEKTGYYSTASNGTELTKSIKKIGRILRNEYIKSHEPQKQLIVENFLKLCEEGFANTINRTVMDTQIMKQRCKIIKLPRTDDIQQLNDFLESVIKENYEKLIETFSISAWRALLEALLTRVQIFNRRRPGEIEMLQIADFKNMQSITEDDEGYKSLSATDKQSAKKYVRIQIRGKLNRTVPVLLDSKMRRGFDMVLKYREEAGVSAKNPYVFGISSQDNNSFLSATKLLRTFSNICGAKYPETLRATNLRKHMATKCTEFQLDPRQVSKVADYLGHDIEIHKNIYRQPVTKVDILDMSRILEKAQNCNHSQATEDTLSETDNSQSNCDTSQETSAIIDTSNCQPPLQSQCDTANRKVAHDGTTRTKWTKDEIRATKHYFAGYFKSQTLPTIPYIRQIQEEHGILNNRTPVVVKARINNQIRVIKKRNEKINKELGKKKVANVNKAKIEKRVQDLFDDFIIRRVAPPIEECSFLKNKDKILKPLSSIYVQSLVIKKIKQN